MVIDEAVTITGNLDVRDSMWLVFPQLTLINLTSGNLTLYPGGYVNADRAHIQMATGHVYNQGLI
ncbi:MAG: hypothetical protein R3330_14965, partial [Saprospiraceae bacterium]|nr:hypothetical protein [Saprospiraceae bacterium]